MRLFAFDLPFLFVCGIFLGYLVKTSRITQKFNWILALTILFLFQTVGILLWLEVLPNSKEFMIIPFNILGMTVNNFEPFLAAILFGLEPLMIIAGEFLILRET